MSDTGMAIVVGLVAICLLVGSNFVGFQAGFENGRVFEKQKAIEAGVGRWTVDPQTGEREFKYGRDGE